MSILSELISSKVRAEIFRLLFGLRDEELHMRELARCSGCAIGTIQTELKKLHRLDLVTPRRDGNRIYYRANKEHPLYIEIHNLVLKTAGLVDVLRQALGKSKQIKIAFIFGSVARQAEMAGSDIDLMIIGELGLRDVSVLLAGVVEQISREINPHLLRIEEFIERKAGADHFISQVLKSPKIFIIGNEDELKAVG